MTRLIGSWDCLHSDRTGAVILDGSGRILPHSGFKFFRSTRAWVEDPSDKVIREFSPHAPLISPEGVVTEGYTENRWSRSSFVSGKTGLTLSGEGVNGSAITLDTGDLIFDSAVTPNSCKFTAGNAHTADLYIQRVTTTVQVVQFPGERYCVFSVDHKDDSGVALNWQLQRSVDSWYYNAATPGWQATAVWNDFPVRSSAFRDFVLVDIGTSDTTITMRVGQKSGGTASRVNHVYHCQFEDSHRFPTSRVVVDQPNDDSYLSQRAASSFVYDNNAGRRMWPTTRGTCLIRFAPYWHGADLSGEFYTLIKVVHDANNSEELYWNDVRSTFTYARRSGGTTTEADRSHTPVRGTEVKLAIRWASVADGELDGLYGTPTSGKAWFDIFSDGVRGGKNENVPPVGSAGSFIRLGNAEGAVRWWRVVPYVMTDTEIVRWSA